MLLQLSIRDFVIVQALELEFQAGFTALTGETGAGPDQQGSSHGDTQGLEKWAAMSF